MAASEINELYRNCLAGDRAAEAALFELLLVRFSYLAYQRVGDRAAAKDVAQNALAIVAEKFREVEIEVSFAAWAAKVLNNCVLRNFQSEKARRDRLASLDDITVPVSKDNPETRLKGRLMACLRRLVNKNRNYARVLNLHYQGYSTDEICRKLGVSSNSAYVSLSRARAVLTACLEETEESVKP